MGGVLQSSGAIKAFESQVTYQQSITSSPFGLANNAKEIIAGASHPLTMSEK